MKLLYRQILISLCGLICLSQVQAASDARAHSSFYIDVYGVALAEETPYLSRAQKIFRNMKHVSGLSAAAAKLIVVDSPDKPWAIALADGNIVLSKGALSVIYADGDVERGDAWMSFVIGHELAHLANRDMWHHEVHMALTGTNKNSDLTGIRQNMVASSLDSDRIRDRELRADESGFIYSALAGYDTERIFAADNSDSSFLEFWVQQTRSFVDAEHHSPVQRTRFLSARLSALQDRIALFEYGVKLAHFGRFEDAAHLLDDFRQIFTSRQVLNNLAYTNIQLARKAMPVQTAYRFWIPTVLETESGLPPTRSFNNELPEIARVRLEEAVVWLRAAVNLDKRDLTVSINLIAALLYLGESHHARAVVEDALKLRPENIQLLGLKALILMEQEPQVDMWPRVSGSLEALTESPKAQDNLLFNYARLLTERGRHGKAKVYWERLLSRIQELPARYQDIVCQQVESSERCWTEIEARRINRHPWNPPIAIGTDVGTAEARDILKSWQKISRQAGPLKVDIYINPEGGSLLAIDYLVELVTLDNHTIVNTNHLANMVGEPGVIMPWSSEEIWSYGASWSAVVAGEQVSEIWIGK